MRYIIMILLLIFAVVFFTGCTDKCITTTKYKTEYVDFQEVEKYRTPLKYEIVGKPSAQGSLKGINYIRIGIVSIKNTDLETGEFVVSQTIDTLEDQPVTKGTRRTIKAGETLPFEEEFDVDLGEDVVYSYKVNPESVVKTRTKTVKKPVTIAYNQTTCS